MSAGNKTNRPKARLAKGFRDISADELRGLKAMLRTIEGVYESYGFDPVEQPFIEYTEALGRFLPDQDRPNEGVFSFQDDDDQWLSLRYDLTAPLARYVAENQQSLAMPYRSYRQGWVFRNEKPGPGRFRQFMQFDADTVGTASPAADAEVCMMAADTMRKLGFSRREFVIKVSNRKILEGIQEKHGLGGPEHSAKRLQILRALDKLDRLGIWGVEQLLTNGREDESGDFTPGANLELGQLRANSHFILTSATYAMNNPISSINYQFSPPKSNVEVLEQWKYLVQGSPIGEEGIRELEEMNEIFESSNYDFNTIRFEPTVVRGLEYYTGPVFECELLNEVIDDRGQSVRFGSVGGGGRYDDLVARFTGQRVPATGFSIGVSRLYVAWKTLSGGQKKKRSELPPVIVLVLDRHHLKDYQRIVRKLRNARIRAEMYVGTSGFSAQMKYADRRKSPIVIIQGTEERASGEVQIKQMSLGTKLAEQYQSRSEYTKARLAQFPVSESNLVPTVRSILQELEFS